MPLEDSPVRSAVVVGDAGLAPVTAGHETEVEGKEATRVQHSFLLELPFLIVGALLVVILTRAFLFMFFYIPSGSMERTLMCNDRVIVNRLAYANHGPSLQDVIVFRHWSASGDVPPPQSTWSYIGSSLKEGVPFLDNPTSQPDLIKRVIGRPGDTVEVRDSRAYVNGRRLDEAYVFLNGPDVTAKFGPVTVPKGQYFVMGDHRNDSADSRFNGGQFVDADAIVGRAFLRVWPFNHWGNLKGPPAASRAAPLCRPGA